MTSSQDCTDVRRQGRHKYELLQQVVLMDQRCKKTNRSMNFAEPERVKILFCRCRQIFHLGSVTQYHIFIKFSRPSLLAKDRLYIFVVEGCSITVICLYNPYYWINDEFIRRNLKMMLETYLKKNTTLNCKYISSNRTLSMHYL